MQIKPPQGVGGGHRYMAQYLKQPRIITSICIINLLLNYLLFGVTEIKVRARALSLSYTSSTEYF
jgi:hypothetical protein